MVEVRGDLLVQICLDHSHKDGGEFSPSSLSA